MDCLPELLIKVVSDKSSSKYGEVILEGAISVGAITYKLAIFYQ